MTDVSGWEHPVRWEQVKGITKTEGHTPPFRGHSWPYPQAPVPHSPLHGLPVREKRAEAGDALESQGAEAPVVHGHRVLLLLQELWGLWENKCWEALRGSCC